MGKNICFIHNGTDRQFDAAEDSMISFLEGLGHDVNVVDDTVTQEDMQQAAAASDLVVISESVNSGNVKLKITDVNVPMLIFEMYAWDEMGLTTDVSTSVDAATTNINVINSDHPLAAGLSGVVPVFSSLHGGTFEDSEGIPRLADATIGPGATVIAKATLSDGGTYDEIFVYQKGATLAQAPADGSAQVASNMRIGIGFDMRSVPAWNDNAFDLFEAAVNYALGIKPPPEAYVPKPANGAVDVPRAEVLKWRRGRFAETHNVYFGSDFNDVNEASLTDDRGVLVASSGLSKLNVSVDVGTLDYGQTYYWRVDEVNAAPDFTLYKGHVWSFTVANFRVLEDFEDYNDTEPHRIFDTWLDGYSDPNNGAVVGYIDPDFSAGEHYLETKIVHGGKQSMPLIYDPDMKIAEANLPLADAGFLTDWTQDDVNALSLWFKGYPASVGGYTEDPAGTFNISASGSDIWGNADEFHFVYKELTGSSMTLVARVDSLFDTGDGWAKAGIMMRDSLDPGARNVGIFVTPAEGTRLQRRSAADGDYLSSSETTLYAGDPNDPSTFPRWLKLERTSGGLTRAYTSPDGSTWTQFPIARSYATMTDPVYVGLAVTSHNADLVTQAQISHVTLTGTGSDGDWQDQDVGIKSNSAESMYVVLNDQLNNQAVVYYQETDPNMPASPTQNKDWRNWVIDLQSFADQGVDLTQVKSLRLGIGTWQDSTRSGGSGLLYIDDMRLYRPPVK